MALDVGEQQFGALKFREWDLDTIPCDAVLTIIGKRRSGKSRLMIDIMYHMQHKIPIFKIISETEELNHDFEDIVPPQFISYELNADEVTYWLRRQKLIKDAKFQAAKFGQPHLAHGMPHNHRIAIIFDDCFSDPKKWRDPKIKRLFVNGRHYDALMVYAMQNPKGTPPDCRGNSDFCVFFKEKNPGQKKKIFTEYVEGMFKNYKEFCRVFDEMTKDNRCMVVNMNADGSAYDCIFHYKAQLYPDKVGSKIPLQSRTMWKTHQHSYDPHGALQHSSGVVLERPAVVSTPVIYRPRFENEYDEEDDDDE